MTLLDLRALAQTTPDDDALTNVLALNARVEAATSPLDMERLRTMLNMSCFAQARVDPHGDMLGFLIGFDQSAAYDSSNFQWFTARFPRFAYVDRVVVAELARGRGVGAELYAAFAEHAGANRLERLTCEVNRIPANPVSDAFHARLGFFEVGRGTPAAGKLVRYLVKTLGPATPSGH